MFTEQLVSNVITEFNLRHANYAGELTATRDGEDIVLQFHGITGTVAMPDGSTFSDLSEEDIFWLHATNAFSELIEIYEQEKQED